MGLIIKATESKKLHINGLSFKPESVYARLRFVGHTDGRKMEIQVDCFETKEQFTAGAAIPVLFEAEGKPNNIQVINAEIQPDELQSVKTAHKYTAQAFIDLGYEVVNDLLPA